MEGAATPSRVLSLIAVALDSCGRDPVDDVGADTFLPDFLDSVVLSSLLVLIEDEWNIEIADEEVDPQLFESVNALAKFVDMKSAR
jgi:acyl carrier protein